MGAAISIPSGGLFYELSTADAIFQQDIVNLGKFGHAQKAGLSAKSTIEAHSKQDFIDNYNFFG